MKTILCRNERKNEGSGACGVVWHSKAGMPPGVKPGKWQARIGYTEGGRKRRKSLGYFDSIEEAQRVYEGARKRRSDPPPVAVVSDEDFEALSAFSWHTTAAGYAVRNRTVNDPGGELYMHRMIAARMGIDISGRTVDHKDGDRLNNQRFNLRGATDAENMRNRPRLRSNSSGVTGVCWDKGKQKWLARIITGGKAAWQRRFDSLDEARIAREAALPEFHGEFAWCDSKTNT